MKLAIIGAGNLGRETAWLVNRINAALPPEMQWELLGFFDNDPAKQGTTVGTLPVLGDIAALAGWEQPLHAVCAIANAKARREIVEQLQHTAQLSFAVLIDPTAIVADSCRISEGAIICANAVLSIDTGVGKHSIVDMGSIVGHDSNIGDFCTLYPSGNVSGNVTVENGVELGVGAKIIEKLTVGQNTIVGAGGVVVRSLPADCTAVGVPAKPIKYHKKTGG